MQTGEPKTQLRILLFVLCAFTLLLVLSFAPASFSFRKYRIKNIDLLSDVRTTTKPVRLKPVTVAVLPAPPPRKDAVTAVAYYPFNAYTRPQKVLDYSVDSNTAGMPRFIAKLRSLLKGEKKKVRIAYLGDSMIEGDLITKDIRRLLQEKFGGCGVGFVPVTSVTATQQSTIVFAESNDWKDISFRTPGKNGLFASGHAFLSAGNSWFEVADNTLYDSVDVSLLFGSGSGNIVCNNTVKQALGYYAFNEMPLLHTRDNVRVDVHAPGLPVFGLSFESATGVILDNLAFRGSSGIELAKLDTLLLQQMSAQRGYDLIVLQYGLNILDDNRDTLHFGWYNQVFSQVLQKIKHCFPEAEILMVSTGDRAFRVQDVYQTTPCVPNLVNAQAQIAYNNQVAFFNLYESMGGENSIVEWADAKPRLAYKDYMHPTETGAARIGGFIAGAILKEMDKK